MFPQNLSQILSSTSTKVYMCVYIGVFRHRVVGTLTSGSMFGELGILMNDGRTASIVAAQDTELAVLDANYYKNILHDADLKKVQTRVDFFTNHFFHQMPF